MFLCDVCEGWKKIKFLLSSWQFLKAQHNLRVNRINISVIYGKSRVMRHKPHVFSTSFRLMNALTSFSLSNFTVCSFLILAVVVVVDKSDKFNFQPHFLTFFLSRLSNGFFFIKLYVRYFSLTTLSTFGGNSTWTRDFRGDFKCSKKMFAVKFSIRKFNLCWTSKL